MSFHRVPHSLYALFVDKVCWDSWCGLRIRPRSSFQQILLAGPCGGGYMDAVNTWMNRNDPYNNVSTATFCYDWNTIGFKSHFQILFDIS
jgi:hypothetical protein